MARSHIVTARRSLGKVSGEDNRAAQVLVMATGVPTRESACAKANGDCEAT